MIVTIVPEDSLSAETVSTALDGEKVTIVGELNAMFYEDDFIDKALAKAAAFDELVESGLIGSETLEQIGYEVEND